MLVFSAADVAVKTLDFAVREAARATGKDVNALLDGCLSPKIGAVHGGTSQPRNKQVHYGSEKLDGCTGIFAKAHGAGTLVVVYLPGNRAAIFPRLIACFAFTLASLVAGKPLKLALADIGGMLRTAKCLLLALTCLACFALPAMANCGESAIEVIGTVEEAEVACEAVARVDAYFADIGLPVEPQVTIQFLDEVEIVWNNGAHLTVSGCFDRTRQQIRIRRWTASVADARQPWGLPWDRSAVLSVIVHELAHASLWVLLKSDPDRLGPAWHEFVAYAVQFQLMDDEQRARILARHITEETFATPAGVNVIAHGLDPDLFGLRSYLFAREKGGASFIRRLIENDVNFDTRGVDMPCP